MRFRTLGLAVCAGLLALPCCAWANDADIARRLSTTLQEAQQEGQLQGFRLGVRVEDGTVWLSGSVADEGQRVLALDKARRVSGVKLVVNDIAIRSTPAAAPVTPASAALAPSAAEGYRAAARAPMPTPAAPIPARTAPRRNAYPVPVARANRPVQYMDEGMTFESEGMMGPVPVQSYSDGYAGAAYDQPQMPDYAWPSYAAHPNYAAVQYPKQYSPMAWPYIGPFYPYPQVPLGWRKVTLEWDDGWWMLDFKSKQ